jgi:hypothetical protein
LIVCGLYTVVWGKSKEKKKNNQLVPSQNSNEFDTVEIVVRPVVEDKSNHNDSNGESQGNNILQVHEHEHEEQTHEHVQDQEKGEEIGHHD